MDKDKIQVNEIEFVEFPPVAGTTITYISILADNIQEG